MTVFGENRHFTRAGMSQRRNFAQIIHGKGIKGVQHLCWEASEQ